MAKRMTREEKQAQREAESRAREAREYRELVKARRKDVVLAGQDDVFAARHDGRLAHVPEETVYALWRMVTAYHDAERAFGNELEWLQREIADQQRYVNEKRIYSSTNLGSKGVRCAEAQAKFFAAREALATLTQALGIHYGGLFTDADNAKRAEWLATEVVRVPGIIRVECEDEQALRDAIAANANGVAYQAGKTSMAVYAAGWRLVQGDRTFCSMPDGSFAFAYNGQDNVQPLNYRDEDGAWLAHKALAR